LLLGVVSAFAIGYGYASRNLLTNLISAAPARRHYKTGDEIKVGDIQGIIVGMDTTSVTLHCGNRQVIVPLQLLANQPVEILAKAIEA
jgi:small-conductance mechanosensitive channel